MGAWAEASRDAAEVGARHGRGWQRYGRDRAPVKAPSLAVRAQGREAGGFESLRLNFCAPHRELFCVPAASRGRRSRLWPPLRSSVTAACARGGVWGSQRRRRRSEQRARRRRGPGPTDPGPPPGPGAPEAAIRPLRQTRKPQKRLLPRCRPGGGEAGIWKRLSEAAVAVCGAVEARAAAGLAGGRHSTSQTDPRASQAGIAS